MGGQNGKEPQCEGTEGSADAEDQRTEHSQSGRAPHTRDGVDNTKSRKLDCGDTAELTDAEAQEPVYCKDHGHTEVTKKDKRKK